MSNTSSVAYIGMPVGCTYCAYSVVSGSGPIARIPQATRIIETPRGKREVCDVHAETRHWGPRSQRVGAVA